MDVSVIIPTYNRLWSLPRAVQSCQGTKCRTEIIVIDDGSTDGTWEWLQQQPGLIAIRQPNQGQTWAVNRGFQSAKGRYVRFLDSDDFLATGAIDRQFDLACATGAQVVYGRVDDYLESTKEILAHADLPDWDDFIAVVLGEGDGSHYLGMLFDRELFATVPPRRPDFSLRDDRMLLHEIALLHPRIARSEGCTGYWVRHGTQMHTGYYGLRTTVAAWQMWQLYERTLSRLESSGELTPRRARAASAVLWTTAHAIARSHLPDALAVVKRIRQIDPGFVPRAESRLTRLLYATLGYRLTQLFFRLRRTLLNRH